MDLRDKLVTLLQLVRRPDQMPAATEHLDRRQDAVERRLNVLSPASARRARQIVQNHH